LRAEHDKAAAHHYLEQVILGNSTTDTVTVDKTSTNLAINPRMAQIYFVFNTKKLSNQIAITNRLLPYFYSMFPSAKKSRDISLMN